MTPCHYSIDMTSTATGSFVKDFYLCPTGVSASSPLQRKSAMTGYDTAGAWHRVASDKITWLPPVPVSEFQSIHVANCIDFLSGIVGNFYQTRVYGNFNTRRDRLGYCHVKNFTCQNCKSIIPMDLLKSS